MISVVINTCNEETYLEDCLKTLGWADEIVIIDMYSTDKSVEIARKYTDKIFYHQKEISVLYARNFSMTKASGDWVLVLDPDEVIPPELSGKLIEISKSDNGYSAAALPFRMYFLGKPLKYVYPVDHKTRFFKKGCVDFPRHVHAHPVVTGHVLTLPMEERFMVRHYVADSISRLLEKFDRYTTDEARHMHEDKKTGFKKWYLIEKPVAEFKNRFLLKGYRDGMEGFIFSVLMAFYRFLTYSKLWELERK